MKNKDSTTSFLLGVNYWPRCSGVHMWQEFDLQKIDAEFRQIRDMGMDTVRVFPLWKDFQPIYEVKSVGGQCRGIMLQSDCSRNPSDCPEMIDENMVAKFDQMVDVAGKYNLKLIVALLTAWMSGTLFDLPWRNGRNFFSDPFMLKWQMLYCRYFARRYAGRKEILYWEYGNEQNCVGPCNSVDTAWTWMHALSNELRINDPGCNVSAGMHGLAVHPSDIAVWGVREAAQAVDVLTTHPYPEFTPGCFLERLTDIRANLHATAQSRFYSGIGGKPTLCEETGSLGNCVLSEESTAEYLRLRLYSLFANGVMGCLWWCFSDFSCRDQLPYRDVQMENDGLGLTTVDGKVKPVGEEIRKFKTVLERLGGVLPVPHRNAAIVVSDKADFWAVYYTTYVLCKQAGIEADFVYPDAVFSGYQLLICPAVEGFDYYDIPHWEKILASVETGSTLYLSSDGASLTSLDRVFGICRTDKLPWRDGTERLTFAGTELKCCQQWRQELIKVDADVVASWQDGTPAMLKRQYGKGFTVFSNAALEKYLSTRKYGLEEVPAWRIYDYLRELSGTAQAGWVADPQTEKTYHAISAQEGYLTLINHNRTAIECRLQASRQPREVAVLNSIDECRIVRDAESWNISLAALQAVILKISW